MVVDSDETRKAICLIPSIIGEWQLGGQRHELFYSFLRCRKKTFMLENAGTRKGHEKGDAAAL